MTESRRDQSAKPVRAPMQAIMHRGVYKALTACFAATLAIFLATFWREPLTLFMLVICTFYFVMYFGLPVIFLSFSNELPEQGPTWREFLRQPFSTNTGPITGREALIQVCTIPAALALCIAGIALAAVFAR